MRTLPYAPAQGAAAFTLRVATTSVSQPAGDASTTLPISTGASRDSVRISSITSRIFVNGIGRSVLTLTRGKSPPRTGTLDAMVLMGFPLLAPASPRAVVPLYPRNDRRFVVIDITTIVQPPDRRHRSAAVLIPRSPQRRTARKRFFLQRNADHLGGWRRISFFSNLPPPLFTTIHRAPRGIP